MPDAGRHAAPTGQPQLGAGAHAQRSALPTLPAALWSPRTVLALQSAVGNQGLAEILSAERGQGARAAQRGHHTLQRQNHTTTEPDATTPVEGGAPVREGDEIPTVAEMAETSMTWIEQVWGALNQGIADFEATSQVTNWEAFAAGVLGNLIWASAAFATGGTAFLISVAGIAVATAGAVSAVDSPGMFHDAIRAESDALANALKQRVPLVTLLLHDYAASQGFGGRQVYRLLMRRLLRADYIVVVGGIPTVNSTKIAAMVKQKLTRMSAPRPRRGGREL